MKLLFLPIDIDISKIDIIKTGHSLHEFNPYWNSTIVKNFDSLESIIQQLPFDKITVCTHKLQQKLVGPHTDVFNGMDFSKEEWDNITEHEPCGFRIIINGGVDKLKIFDGESWTTARVPHTPMCYVLNSTECKHMVEADSQRETLYFRGFINTEKYTELINRSLTRFKDYAIYHQ